MSSRYSSTTSRKRNVILDAYTLEEIKQMEKEQLLDVKSVVTTYDLDVIRSVMDQPSRMWISKKIIGKYNNQIFMQTLKQKEKNNIIYMYVRTISSFSPLAILAIYL